MGVGKGEKARGERHRKIKEGVWKQISLQAELKTADRAPQKKCETNTAKTKGVEKDFFKGAERKARDCRESKKENEKTMLKRRK